MLGRIFEIREFMLSGGEPLAQAGFAAAIIDRIRAKEPRLTYAIETSGFAPAEAYRTVVSRLDFVYQDVKFPDLDGYRRWTYSPGFDESRDPDVSSVV